MSEAYGTNTTHNPSVYDLRALWHLGSLRSADTR